MISSMDEQPEEKRQKTGGRQKGTPNKLSSTTKDAINDFIADNAFRLNQWIKEIEAISAKDAFMAYMSVLEFGIPKLARSETHLSGGITVTHEEQLTILENLAVSTSTASDKLIQ